MTFNIFTSGTLHPPVLKIKMSIETYFIWSPPCIFTFFTEKE